MRRFFVLLSVMAAGILLCSCGSREKSDCPLAKIWLSGTTAPQCREILLFHDNWCVMIPKVQNQEGFSLPERKIPYRRTGNEVILETSTATAGTLCRLERNGALLRRIWGGGKGEILYFPITEAEADLLFRNFKTEDVTATLPSLPAAK